MAGICVPVVGTAQSVLAMPCAWKVLPLPARFHAQSLEDASLGEGKHLRAVGRGLHLGNPGLGMFELIGAAGHEPHLEQSLGSSVPSAMSCASEAQD